MKLRGLKTARRVGHWLSSRATPRALVLGYHRVASEQDDVYNLCTPPERFEEHLEVIRRESTPLVLDELLDGLERGRLPRRALSVTLDDGYADALHGAAPLLTARGVPAAVFVTSGLLGEVPWWEALAAAVPSADRLPERLALEIEGRRLGWESPNPAAIANVSLRVARIHQLHRVLLDWPPEARGRGIETLRHALRPSDSQPPPPRGLTQQELVQLAGAPGLRIGAHGVHHPVLAALDEDQQRYEIAESKRALEAVLGRALRAFSYPNGSSTPRTQEIVRESGFDCAFASGSGVATPGGDRFLLPRFWVGHMLPEKLRQLIRHWR